MHDSLLGFSVWSGLPALKLSALHVQSTTKLHCDLLNDITIEPVDINIGLLLSQLTEGRFGLKFEDNICMFSFVFEMLQVITVGYRELIEYIFYTINTQKKHVWCSYMCLLRILEGCLHTLALTLCNMKLPTVFASV